MGRSSDSYNKKEREKKRRKRKQEKEERKKQRKLEGKTTEEFMYVDAEGNLTSTPPDTSKKEKINLEDINISTPKKEDLEETDSVRTGTVKFFNHEKGYGFITDSATKESYFVHVNNLESEVKDNDKVVFEIGSGPKGPIALAVKIA